MSIRDNLFIRLLISAKDDASDKIKGITSSVGGLVAKVVASALAFLSFKGALDAAEALEVQMGKLRGAVAATGGAAGLTAEEIDVMARNLDEATLGGAANIRDAAAQLLTFKSVGKDAFERTLKAAQDLSSTGFGSVEQSAVQLGKALEDPLAGLGALTRVGVSFNASQKEQIENFVKLGQVAQAQNVILAAVEGQVKGVASAAGAGLAGAVDLVGKRLTDLKEIIGGQIIGVWGQLNLQFADFVNQAKQAAASGTVIRDTLVLLGLVVTRAGGAFQYAGTAIGSFFAALATRDFSGFLSTMETVDLQLRQRMADMAALSDTFKERFELPADVAARLAELTGKVAAKTQQAAQAAGAAGPPVAALAGGYERAATSLEHLRAAQEAWSQVQRDDAALHGNVAEQLQLDIANAEKDANTKITQSLAADNAARSAQTYYESLKQLGTASAEVIEKARAVAEARRAEAETTAAAAVAAGQYLLKARSGPQTQALAMQTSLLRINLDYEARIAALRNKGLSQQQQDSRNASAAQVALAQATLLRFSITEKTSAAEKKSILDRASALVDYAKASAAQVQNAEKGISLLGQLQAEENKIIQALSDDTEVKAIIEADDKPARKQAAAFIEWVGKQKAVLNVEIKTNKFGDGKSVNSLVDSLTRSAAAQ